jgi:pimeloyl-ACP methyl ester carboxylesterase
VALSAMPAGTLVEPVVLTSADGATSRGLFYRLEGRHPRVGVHLMHPRTDQSLNYNIAPLVAAGYAVLGRAGRAVNNDVDTVHEEILLDVAAGVRWLREWGCEQVVLLGNSGGGSLACLYQQQALAAPAERLGPQPYSSVDPRSADLPAADGLALIGIHRGEGQVLREMLDPSVIDEGDPYSCDPDLDMYDPGNGFRVPIAGIGYDGAFLERYRAGQLRRVRRLDDLARASLDAQARAAQELAALPGDASPRQRLDAERRSIQTRFLTIYRTTADPAMVDLSIDPDDRLPGGHDGHQRPDLQNWSTTGFARILTPRAWLSTWSAESSHADTLRTLASVTSPTLVVHYAGDVYTRIRDARALCEAAATDDKTFVVVRHADHYGRPIEGGASSADRVTEGTAAVVEWMTSRYIPN